MAEMIVADFIAKASLRNPEICIEERQHSAEMNSDGLVIKGTFSLTKSDPHNDKKKPVILLEPRGMHQQCVKDQFPRDRPTSNSFSKARMMRNSHLKNIGKSNSTPLKEVSPLQVVGNNQKSRESPLATRPPSRQKNPYSEFESLKEGKVAKVSSPGYLADSSVSSITKSADGLEFLDIEEDIDDELQNLDLISLRSRSKHTVRSNRKLEDISIADAIALREVVFGNATSVSFNPEWEQQSFTFNDSYELEFGLVQHKGGPCGILAAVQALIIKHLMEHNEGNLSPSNAERQQVLKKVLASILWQAANYAGGKKVVCVCSDSGRNKFQSSILYRNDGITEKVQYSRCLTLADTENCVQEFLPQLQSHMGKGCILFLYSVILSRG